jgi:type II secretory pathway pseudopilin PulG
LLELFLVLGIFVVLGAFAVPNLTGTNSQAKETAASDAVRAAWTSARAQAMKEGRPYRFAVVWNKGNFRVAPDSDDFWKGSSGQKDSNNPPLILEEALPEGVCFFDPSKGSPSGGSGDGTCLPPDSVNPSQYTSVVVFNPDGSASDDVRLEFGPAGGGSSSALEVRAFTGTTVAE